MTAGHNDQRRWAYRVVGGSAFGSEPIEGETPFWDHPNARTNVPLREVVVRAEHTHGSRPRLVTMDVQDFVVSMVQTAHYPLREVPREAVLSAAVDFFICMAENGGIHGFAGNGGLIEPLNHNIRDGLKRLGLSALSEIFAELEAFARTDPERFENCDWTDPTMRELDQRFGALPHDEYFERHAEWIRGWPNLRVVPSAGYNAVINELDERRTPHPDLGSSNDP